MFSEREHLCFCFEYYFHLRMNKQNQKTANPAEEPLAHTLPLCRLEQDGPSVTTVIQAKSLAGRANCIPLGQAPLCS